MISGQRVVSVDPEVVIIAGLNDQLHSRRMLNAFIDRLIPCSEVIGEVIKTLLYAMLEAEKSIGECFARQLVKVIFVLSTRYALLPEPLHFVYAMVVLLDKG